MLKILGVISFCIFVSVVVAKSIGPPESKATEAPCVSDWTKCTDNMDVANHYKDMRRLRQDCKWEVNKKVKYGEAKWPWGYAFGSLYVGDSALKTGIITLVEPDVQLQNQFGAMVHSEVDCTYNLKENKITSTWIKCDYKTGQFTCASNVLKE